MSAQRQGCTREAAAALTLYAFGAIGLKRLTLLCDDENIKSIALAQALGFDLETRAKGLQTIPGATDLRLARRYVRFDSTGLEGWKVEW